MFRYIAFIWDPVNTDQSASVRLLLDKMNESPLNWRIGYAAYGFQMYFCGLHGSSYEFYRLPDQRGIVLGKLFPGRESIHAVQLTERKLEQIGFTDGRSLVEEYWGYYVAFMYDDRAKVARVIRDPSGNVRCYVTKINGAHIFFSNIEDCVALGVRFSIDWEYVAAELTSNAMMGWSRTGLKEVVALTPGECSLVNVSSEESRSVTYWDPVSVAAHDTVEHPQLAIDSLFEAIRLCVRAIASCHDKIVLLLSGGLDSSVLASCLRDESDRIECLHYYCPGPYSDERMFARLAAHSMGKRVHELERDADIRLDSLLALPLSTRPSESCSDHVMHRNRTTKWARDRGATGVFYGQMGDQFFYQKPRAYPVIDRVWTHGLKPRVLSAALDTACISETALWSTLLLGVFYGLLTKTRARRLLIRRQAATRLGNRLVNSASLLGLNYRFREQWLASVDHLPPGKVLHIGDICSAQAYFGAVGGPNDPEWVSPLNAQPIIEACLRIPTYLLVQGGWDRSLLRQAFADHVPHEIIARRPKGAGGRQVSEVYSRNLPFIRELLFGGILVKERLVDRARLETVLSQEWVTIDSMDLPEVLWTEAWVRRWHEHAGGCQEFRV